MDITPEWLAGFFDGEGSVSVARHGASFNIIINITNRNWEVIASLTSKFESSTLQLKKETIEVKRKDCFVIQWRGRSAKPILLFMLPHLRLKYKRALLALEIIKSIEDSEYRRSLSQETIIQRERLASLIAEANDSKLEDNIKLPII